MTIILTIAKRFSFAASHRLPSLPDGHPCKRLHGHNYEVELRLKREAAELDEHGMVLDYRAMDRFKDLVNALDHTDLNTNPELPQWAANAPTAENLAVFFLLKARDIFPVAVDSVLVSEGPKTWAEARFS